MMKRIFAAFCAVIMLACALASCSGGEFKSTAEEARVVGKCGGYDVKYEELRFLTLTCKAELAEKYGEEIFAPEYSGHVGEYIEELEERVEEQLEQNYASLKVFAEAGIKTTDSVTKQDVNAYVDSIINALGGEEEYKAYLAECYMTDAVVRFNNALDSCVYRYFEKISEEWDKEAYDAVMAKDGFIRTRSIFVRNDDGESVAENRKTAERVLSEIKGGKPLTSFIGKKENQDYGSCDYYFMKGYFEEEYEEAAFALEVGEVSEVVETDGGFYIIERVEPDDGYFLDNLNALKSIYVECKMYEVINEAADRIEFEFNDYGKTIDLWTME